MLTLLCSALKGKNTRTSDFPSLCPRVTSTMGCLAKCVLNRHTQHCCARQLCASIMHLQPLVLTISSAHRIVERPTFFNHISATGYRLTPQHEYFICTILFFQWKKVDVLNTLAVRGSARTHARVTLTALVSSSAAPTGAAHRPARSQNKMTLHQPIHNKLY